MVLIQNRQKTLEKLLKLENLPKLEKFLKQMNGLNIKGLAVYMVKILALKFEN